MNSGWITIRKTRCSVCERSTTTAFKEPGEKGTIITPAHQFCFSKKKALELAQHVKKQQEFGP